MLWLRFDKPTSGRRETQPIPPRCAKWFCRLALRAEVRERTEWCKSEHQFLITEAMDFNLTEEQTMLRDSLARYLDDRYDFHQRRNAINSRAGWRAECWKDFAEMGLLGAALPEELGGLGGGPVENMIVMEQFGAALVVEPFLGCVVIGGGFIRHGGGGFAHDIGPRVAVGEAVIAFAQSEPGGRSEIAAVQTSARRDAAGYVLNGTKSVVVGAPWATHLVVTARTSGVPRDRDGVSVFLVEKGAKGITAWDYPTVDGMRASEVQLNDVAVPRSALIGEEGQGLPLIERVVDEAIVALCAEGVGVMHRLLSDTVDYARQRKQFGVPIGSFQALQHRMADMFVALEQSISITAVATMKLAGTPVERARAASGAKVHVGKSLRLVGQGAVQIHGAMGLTEDLAVGHYFKRATVIENELGSVDHHLRRYAQLAFA